MAERSRKSILIALAGGAVRLTRAEWVLLLSALTILGFSSAFASLADEVLEGETQRIDRAVLSILRPGQDGADPIGPAWFEEMMRDATSLGGVFVLSLLTGAVVTALLLQKRLRWAVFVALSIIGGVSASLVLKSGFGRERPEFGVAAETMSFPSGHSMMATVVYLTLGALLAGLVRTRSIKAYVFVLALFVTFAVGFSRAYLGAHWPSDVLGGWAAGGAWAALGWLAAHVLQRLGWLERFSI